MKVLFIAGVGRSGSTLLDSTLGQMEGFFSGGQILDLWASLFSGSQCACRCAVSDCPVWGSVVREVDGLDPSGDAAMIALQARLARSRNVPSLLLGNSIRSPEAREYARRLGTLYGAIGRVTGSSVIVDSSKLPAYGLMLLRAPGVELSVVHLVRDPRGVAYSWVRRSLYPRRTPLNSVLFSAMRWNALNLSSEVLARRAETAMRLRYEDFVADPSAALRRMARMVGRDDVRLDFVTSGAVRFEATHVVAGNPTRFNTGTIELRADDEWRTRLRPHQRLAVTALTAPLLVRYGYPLNPAVSTDGY